MIAHVIVRTSKLNESLEFYQWILDLPVSARIQTPAGEIVFLGENETKLEFIEDAKAEKIESKGLTIGFSVDELEKKIALLDSRNIPHSEIVMPNPSTRFIIFGDLNGCEIQLIEQKK